MNKILLLLISLFYGSFASEAQTAATSGTGFNYSSFTIGKKNITPELQSLTDKKYYEHPEYGVLPYNAPCTDCVELLQKRDETHRYFVKEGSDGKEFYQQSSYGSMSYEEGGVLRTIDHRLRPSGKAGVFKAQHQPFPVAINIPERFSSLINAGNELQVNRDVHIFIRHKDGSETSLGEPNWSDYTAGDDGIVVHNFYPGIDLELHVGKGSVESFYRLNKPLAYLLDGWLIIRDNMKVPEGLVYDYTYSEKNENNSYEGTLFINDKDGTHYFYIGTPAAYDENNEHDNAINLNYQIADNGTYDLYVPVDWMNDPNRSYPLIIDPYVSVKSSLPQAQITGSGYNATCFQNGCTYNLDVNVPAACTVYDLLYSFNYRALGSCNLNQAAWDLKYGICKSPLLPGTFHTCTVGLPGLCILQNLSCWISSTENMYACITPQCAPHKMPFTLTFYRCAGTGAGCGFSCINADTPWDMTVKGYYITVEAPNISICQGQPANLIAVPDSGIQNGTSYTFKWYDINNLLIGTGNPLTVSPSATTGYKVTAFDCQNQGLDTLTDSAQVTVIVTVNPNDNPGFTINPDSTCRNSPVAISGLGAGSASSYDWILFGGTPPSANDQQNINAAYSNAGNYDITLRWTSPTSGCVFDSTKQIVVLPCVGIGELYLPDIFNLYPNPANTQLTLQSSFLHLNEEVKISITNLLGEIMQEEKRKWMNEASINIKSLPSGIYFMQVESEKGRSMKRFVKE